MKLTLEQRKYNKLMKIAVYYVQKAVFPLQMEADDTRSIREVEKARKQYAIDLINNSLPKR